MVYMYLRKKFIDDLTYLFLDCYFVAKNCNYYTYSYLSIICLLAKHNNNETRPDIVHTFIFLIWKIRKRSKLCWKSRFPIEPFIILVDISHYGSMKFYDVYWVPKIRFYIKEKKEDKFQYWDLKLSFQWWQPCINWPMNSNW